MPRCAILSRPDATGPHCNVTSASRSLANSLLGRSTTELYGGSEQSAASGISSDKRSTSAAACIRGPGGWASVDMVTIVSIAAEYTRQLTIHASPRNKRICRRKINVPTGAFLLTGDSNPVFYSQCIIPRGMPDGNCRPLQLLWDTFIRLRCSRRCRYLRDDGSDRFRSCAHQWWYRGKRVGDAGERGNVVLPTCETTR